MQRVAGAVMGALIGDALALGCHWYYDLAELRRECGPWITDYLTPRPGRYHSGLRAGDSSPVCVTLHAIWRWWRNWSNGRSDRKRFNPGWVRSWQDRLKTSHWATWNLSLIYLASGICCLWKRMTIFARAQSLFGLENG